MAGASAGCSLLLSVQSAGVASTLGGPRSITPQISTPDLLPLPFNLHHRKAVGERKGGKCTQRSETLCQVGRRAGELYAAAASLQIHSHSAACILAKHSSGRPVYTPLLCDVLHLAQLIMAFSAKAGHSHYGYV